MINNSGIVTDDSMLRFGDKLTQAVADKLLKLGLVEVANDY